MILKIQNIEKTEPGKEIILAGDMNLDFKEKNDKLAQRITKKLHENGVK
jgi:chemotaxis response regulator CheB